MKEQLEHVYRMLMDKYGFESSTSCENLNRTIKNLLSEFLHECKTPAIWCYGRHTKMMMADFMFEMKQVKTVIDDKFAGAKESGFSIITEEEIENNRIDAVIISSFIYREEIKAKIRSKYPDIKYLDIYEKLSQRGIDMGCEYYSRSHPYGHYTEINKLRRMLPDAVSQREKESIVEELIGEYLAMKDFKTAAACLKEQLNIHASPKFQEMLKDIQSLYRLEIDSINKISENNVVMLCIDGMRRRDILDGLMPQIRKLIEDKMYFYQNAYSVSTSTYESLLPAYSENSDLRTKYYENVSVSEEQCRFAKEAVRQKRNIFFYTDSTKYVDSKNIKVTDNAQTVTEKMWDFILDSLDEWNGLFYIHILFESHFSYPNPYTIEPIIADGSSILFDYLSRNGGALRADYVKQHKDALAYIDDVLYPLLTPLKCSMVLYADHGNILPGKKTPLEDIEAVKYTFGEELIQVPLAVKSDKNGIGSSNALCSIMELNAIIIALLNQKKVELPTRKYIKVQRSQIYNPDFKYLYHKTGNDRGLMAFEAFIFRDGYKLAVYADGESELYNLASDKIIEDEVLKAELMELVKGEITVCG